jgi:pyruvate/2-oxoglutarate dehydrogenase complex dihydrolipoamide dehydrogenase (E3) component
MTREDAVQVGQRLMTESHGAGSKLEHATRDYATLLDDSTIYYRFISPQERGSENSDKISWSDFIASKSTSSSTTNSTYDTDAITVEQHGTVSVSSNTTDTSLIELPSKDQDVTAHVWPHDQYNIELLNHVHPLNWQDPAAIRKTTKKDACDGGNNYYDMVVIGGGSAGLITAAGSAGIGGLRVALIEAHLLGGDCLNVGCVPSKTLIHSANLAHTLHSTNTQRLKDAGIAFDTSSVQVDFGKVMERVRQVRSQISHHDSAQRFSQELGVEVYIGYAKFTSPTTISVNGQTLTFKRAIATGASPSTSIDNMDGLNELYQQCKYETATPTNQARPMVMTNETIFNLTKAPKKLIVIGTGVIGLELGQAMQRLGIPTAILGRSGSVLTRKEDADLAKVVQDQMTADGVEFRLNVTKYIRIELTGVVHENGYPEMKLTVQEKSGNNTVTNELFCDTLLIALGRNPNVTGIGLEVANVKYDKTKGLLVNDKFQTTNPRVYGVGDCCANHFKFTHAADFMARAVIRNAFFFGKETLSSLLIPHATFTSPEIASVGLSSFELKDKGIEYRIIEKEFKLNDRAITDDSTLGMVRFRIHHKTDEILGATIVGDDAGNMISEITVAMKAKVGLGKLASVIHPYPTTAETIRQCGDLYNKTRLTTSVKSLLRGIVQIQR